MQLQNNLKFVSDSVVCYSKKKVSLQKKAIMITTFFTNRLVCKGSEKVLMKVSKVQASMVRQIVRVAFVYSATAPFSRKKEVV